MQSGIAPAPAIRWTQPHKAGVRLGGGYEKGAGVIREDFQDFAGLVLGARRIAGQRRHCMFTCPRGRNALCRGRA